MSFDDIVREARQRKEAWIRARPDDSDLRPTIIIEREGQQVMIIQASTMDKEAGLHAARLGAQGYGADALTILLDAHIKLMKPDEEFPAPGELERQCNTEGPCDRELISDALLIQRINKQGHTEVACLPYKYHGSETIFRWTHGPEEFRETTGGGEGYIGDCLKEALEDGQRHQLATAIKIQFGLDRARAQLHADAVTTMTLELMGFQITPECIMSVPTNILATTATKK